MKAARHRSLRTGQLWTLLLAALLLRALVPQGWMPDSDAGGFTIRICDGAGALVLPDPTPAMGAHHRAHQSGHQADHDERHGDTGHEQCSFAGLSAPMASPPPALEVPTLAPHVVYLVPLRPSASARISTSLPPPARAPPASA